MVVKQEFESTLDRFSGLDYVRMYHEQQDIRCLHLRTHDRAPDAVYGPACTTKFDELPYLVVMNHLK